MYKEFDLAPGSTLTAQVNYAIEDDWDYAYLVVSTDGGDGPVWPELGLRYHR